MKPSSNLIGPLMQAFFLEFLCTQKRVSPQTVSSYRDTFRLLLQHVQLSQGISPETLRVEHINAETILSFLDHLEQKRNNSICSRNVRLSAIRSFFRFIALREPDCLNQCTCVLSIPAKRTDKRLVKSLSREEVDAIISAPDRSKWRGRRDHAILLTLYNSGARASEITALTQSQVMFGKSNFLLLHGKGRKERTVPLWTHTAKALRSWFGESVRHDTDLAFPNATGESLTRNGLNYILQQAVCRASKKCPSLLGGKVTPHMMRHSTAAHLLQSGVDISVIALWLGHESIETTHVYLEADLATKERALRKLTPAGTKETRFRADDKVLAFLATL
jgi:site-specific recombinase XerD